MHFIPVHSSVRAITWILMHFAEYIYIYIYIYFIRNLFFSIIREVETVVEVSRCLALGPALKTSALIHSLSAMREDNACSSKTITATG